MMSMIAVLGLSTSSRQLKAQLLCDGMARAMGAIVKVLTIVGKEPRDGHCKGDVKMTKREALNALQVAINCGCGDYRHVVADGCTVKELYYSIQYDGDVSWANGFKLVHSRKRLYVASSGTCRWLTTYGRKMADAKVISEPWCTACDEGCRIWNPLEEQWECPRHNTHTHYPTHLPSPLHARSFNPCEHGVVLPTNYAWH